MDFALAPYTYTVALPPTFFSSPIIDLIPTLLKNDTIFSIAISYNGVDGGANESTFTHEPFAIDKSFVGVPEQVAAEYTPTFSDVSVSFNIAEVPSDIVVH